MLAAGVLAAAGVVGIVQAQPKTVCTITVNSPDEKEVLRRSLPADQFRFVELVEHGRPDWLASACRAGVHCDVLVISGHFDGGTEFYTDRLEQREFLPVEEMERVSCSDSCPGLFSELKEVYLFGCNTLNPDELTSAASDVARRLVRAGWSPVDAERLSRGLSDRYRESNRDRMRQVFKDVPVIYGFSAKAPLGPYAAATLDRYFQSAPSGEFGSGQPSAKLVSLFAPVSMTVASGLTDADSDAAFRRDACRFADDRLSAAQKVGFVHDLLRREMADVRMMFDVIEKYALSLTPAQREIPAVSRALDEIARDATARERYLTFTRETDEPAVRARMLALARNVGWLDLDEINTEYRRMIVDRLRAGSVGPADVSLACSLNGNHELGGDLPRVSSPATGQAALLACLDSAEAQARVLRALTSGSDEDAEIAQVYFRHRPISDADELRFLTASIARMKGASAQVRALESLAGYRLTDPDSLDELARLFRRTTSVDVQRAIAAIMIRGDYHAIARPEVVSALRAHRLKSSGGEDVRDVLIRRLQMQMSL